MLTSKKKFKTKNNLNRKRRTRQTKSERNKKDCAQVNTWLGEHRATHLQIQRRNWEFVTDGGYTGAVSGEEK